MGHKETLRLTGRASIEEHASASSQTIFRQSLLSRRVSVLIFVLRGLGIGSRDFARPLRDSHDRAEGATWVWE